MLTVNPARKTLCSQAVLPPLKKRSFEYIVCIRVQRTFAERVSAVVVGGFSVVDVDG